MKRNTSEGTTIPAVMIVCEHCGFIAQHALQPLGVWPHAARELEHEVPRREAPTN